LDFQHLQKLAYREGVDLRQHMRHIGFTRLG
jgi:hypothetical protein